MPSMRLLSITRHSLVDCLSHAFTKLGMPACRRAKQHLGRAQMTKNLISPLTATAPAKSAFAPLSEAQTARLRANNLLSNAGLSELERAVNLGILAGPDAPAAAGTYEDWNPIGLDFGGGLAVSSVGSINSNRTEFNIDGTADLNARLLGTANPQYQHKTQWLNSADPLVNQLLVWKAESIHYKNRSCSHSYLLVYSTKTHLKTTKKYSKRATNKGKNHFVSKKQSDLGRKSSQIRLFTGSSSYEMCSNFTSRIP